MKILVIGSGAREHALCDMAHNSPLVSSLYCAPGNAGISQIAKCVADLGAQDVEGIVTWCQKEQPDLVIIGPDDTLAAGIVNELDKINIPAFGPTKEAAKIEWSKAYMKDLCRQHGIKTAAYGRFDNIVSAQNFINSMDTPIVVKADGLALGKGVLICESRCDAIAAANNMLSGESFGKAGQEIVIEEFLQGFEVSCFAFVDGETVVPIGHAQDYKRALEGDKGPNTGGMGAISPLPQFSSEMHDEVITDIIKPLAKALKDDGRPYRGVVFAGIMVDPMGVPYVIEFNARWGDPETQSILPRVKDDLIPYFMATAKGELHALENKPITLRDEKTFGVFMAADGYPESYPKNTRINLPETIPEDIHIFHAGTKFDDNQNLLNGGGRTLSVVALDKDLEKARDKAYSFIDTIDWPEGFYRTDIGWRAFEAKS